MNKLLLILFTLISLQTKALNFSGSVVDHESKEPIPFATILFVEIETGITSDKNGKFLYTGKLPQHTKVIVNATGYESLFQTIENPDTVLTFEMEKAHIELEEFMVASVGTMQDNSITNVERKSMEELSIIQPNDIGEAIANIPSVYNLSTGTGISKPVIRGMSGMRVVTYYNGLRIENQQWGGDHGMGINDNGIGSVEIIKGPSSLLFGADALGGVLYLSEEPYADQNSTAIYYKSGFESNAMKLDNSFGLKTSKNKLKFNLFANYTTAADYQLANGKYVKNSRYNQKDVKASIGYNKNNWVMNARYNYNQSRIGIPGHTHDSIYTVDDFLSTKQGRDKSVPAQDITNHFALLENKFYLKNSTLKIRTGFTSNELIEYHEKFTVEGIDMILNNYTYNIIWDRSISKDHHLIFGSQGMMQRIINQPNAEEQLIPNASIDDIGGYILLQGKIQKWNYQIGGRYDQRYLMINNSDFDINNKSYNGINYSAGINKSFNKIKVRLNASSGFRPPHSSELLINGIHHGTMRYEIGSTELKSEKGTQLDFALEYKGEHLFLGFNPYINVIKNYIYITPVDSSVNNYPVYEYTQDPNAKLYGGDFSFHYHPHFAHKLHIEHNTSYIYAEKSDGSTLPLIPQTRLNTQLKYQLEGKKKVHFEYIALQHLYFFDQNRVDLFETVSKGYNLFHLGTSLDVNSKLPIKVQFGVKNLLNVAYTNHLSRLKNYQIPAPGRNFYITLKININHIKK